MTTAKVIKYLQTTKRCEAPGCDRWARSGINKYCDTHYIRLRHGYSGGLKPLIIGTCLECGAPNKGLQSKCCSRLCMQRHKRGTPLEKRRKLVPSPQLVDAEIRIWRAVPDFPNYEISNDGRLRRVTGGSNSKPGYVIRPTIGSGGYPNYGLTGPDGKRRHRCAHHLVARAFLRPPRPDQPLILHKNDNRLDARDTNLRWGTAADNANDAIRNGRVVSGAFHPSTAQPWTRPRGDGHTWTILTEDQVRIILRSPENSTTLGERYGVSKDAIWRIKNGKNWRHITDPAYGVSLIEGAMNFASPVPKRKKLSTHMRFDLLKRENYRCHICKGLIYPGQGWDVSHDIPLELGGGDDDANRKAAHRKCHRVHTATVDMPAIARAKRIRAKHHAGSVSLRPMRGGRDDALKRKMDGMVVLRATGLPFRRSASR